MKSAIEITEKQIKERNIVWGEGTDGDIKLECLHKHLFSMDGEISQKTALIWYEGNIRKELNYEMLRYQSLQVADMLKHHGVSEGDMVAVILPKGVEQIRSVLGILAAGAVYIPIAYDQPLDRINEMLQIGNVKYTLTDDRKECYLNEKKASECIQIAKYKDYSGWINPVLPSVNAIAYIIFTSGSTGNPKGVMVSHESAFNTIKDVNKRFHVTEKDCLIGLSELSFDLSVYDIFGMIECGGSMLILNEEEKKEPRIWYKYLKENEITLWNSVPALYEMLIMTAEQHHDILPLKKVFLSGDWIKLDLYDRTNRHTLGCQFISLGGATEASIWSNYYEVKKIDEKWKSIPYGVPLGNQKMRIMDSEERDCSEFIAGELWIGGQGVAEGYINQLELTRERFLDFDGERWYRTGDKARYMEHGIIEFLGRMDHQVKINGFRIELGEIEQVLKRHSMIGDSVVIVRDGLKKHLISAVVPKRGVTVLDIELCQESIHPDEMVEIEERNKIVEKFLLYLLFPDGINMEWSGYLEGYRLKHGITCLVDWLEKREVIRLHYNKIIEGKRLEEVKNRNLETSPLGISLFENQAIVRDVLYGKKEATYFLQIPVLNPETLLLRSHIVKMYILEISDWLKLQFTENKSKRKLAFLDARSGKLAKGVIDQIKDMYDITLFDRSAGMLNAARENLEEHTPLVEFQKLTDSYISGRYVEKFDYLISFNSLHQYLDGVAGLQIADLLLKHGGTFLCMEYTGMEGMALVSSAILEDGFKAYEGKRSRKQDPFLTVPEWMEAFQKTNFERVCIKNDPLLSVMRVKAVKGVGFKLAEEGLKRYCGEKLPDYMCPDEYFYYREFPLNQNGKIGRDKIIPEEIREIQSGIEGIFCTEMEAQIASIWKTLLHTNTISRESNFFETGGDSLIATSFVNVISKGYGMELTLGELFSKAKLYQIADLIEVKSKDLEDMVEGEI